MGLLFYCFLGDWWWVVLDFMLVLCNVSWWFNLVYGFCINADLFSLFSLTFACGSVWLEVGDYLNFWIDCIRWGFVYCRICFAWFASWKLFWWDSFVCLLCLRLFVYLCWLLCIVVCCLCIGTCFAFVCFLVFCLILLL